MPSQSEKHIYDIALSFAEEDRLTALAIHQAFTIINVDSFYYANKKYSTVGKSLSKMLKGIYGKESKAVLVLFSKDYCQGKYSAIEWNVIRKRFLKDKSEDFFFPIKIDETPLSHFGLPEDTAYWKWDFEPEKITAEIKRRLGEKCPDHLTNPSTEFNVQAQKIGQNIQTNDISGGLVIHN